MKMTRVALAAAALLAAPLALAQAPAPEQAPAKKLSYTDDYRISVDDDAGSDGEIKKAFVEQLGTQHYNIEMESGENVIIERSMGSENISLVLVSSTVKGVDVKVHRD